MIFIQWQDSRNFSQSYDQALKIVTWTGVSMNRLNGFDRIPQICIRFLTGNRLVSPGDWIIYDENEGMFFDNLKYLPNA